MNEEWKKLKREATQQHPASGLPVIILDRPSHPGNIGAAARAMTNMGLKELRLVAPQQFPHPEAEQFATAGRELLSQVRVFPTLTEAVADIHFLAATTNRHRGQRQNVLSPRELAVRLADLHRDDGMKTGILFGTERTGLHTTDVERADVICTIPTLGEHASLNLAQAVVIIAYETMLAMGQPGEEGNPLASGLHKTLATFDEMERLFRHMEEVLRAIDFIKSSQGPHMMGSLRAIYHRAALDTREVNILRGILHETMASRSRGS